MDKPPSYEAASGSSSRPDEASHQTRNGIPPRSRRSMEDEQRPLPEGWIRQYDPKEHHQYFVDTRANPPRSIWHHPLDDEQYLSTLDPFERDNVTRLNRSVSIKDIEAESSDDEADEHEAASKKGALRATAPAADQPHGLHKYGRKIKDKLTGSTHEQREAERRQREAQEQAAYEIHLAARRAMARAMEMGQPQYLCKDKNGRDVYIEPPYGPRAPPGAYGYNPYSQGPYANPNARFIRPDYPYNRPYGYGYGGGYGFPLMGGFLGGALLGGLLF